MLPRGVVRRRQNFFFYSLSASTSVFIGIINSKFIKIKIKYELFLWIFWRYKKRTTCVFLQCCDIFDKNKQKVLLPSFNNRIRNYVIFSYSLYLTICLLNIASSGECLLNTRYLLFYFSSRSGYDSSSGGESDSEYSTSISQINQIQNQVQNQASINAPSHGQGKHINKGRWTKEEVRLNIYLYLYVFLFTFQILHTRVYACLYMYIQYTYIYIYTRIYKSD